jgi:AmmeMemoRadiSam system protein A
MGDSKPTAGRVGATIVLLLALAFIVVWLVRGGFRRQQSASLAAEPRPAGAPVTEQAQSQPTVSPEDRQQLIRLARQTIEEVVRLGRQPEVDPSGLSSRLREKTGCFVTLEIAGQLRGCIGHIVPREPLYQAVIDNARSAATRDMRFSPVTVEELPRIEVEVSVLTVPVPLAFESPEDLLQKLRPHHDGVVLSVGARRATFLPQVWEKLSAKEVFLQHLSTKAGLGPDGWRSPEAKVDIYHVEAFKESEFAAPGQAPAAPSAAVKE